MSPSGRVNGSSPEERLFANLRDSDFTGSEHNSRYRREDGGPTVADVFKIIDRSILEAWGKIQNYTNMYFSAITPVTKVFIKDLAEAMGVSLNSEPNKERDDRTVASLARTVQM